jgi:multidrug transporter EmrE-like cation transporter
MSTDSITTTTTTSPYYYWTICIGIGSVWGTTNALLGRFSNSSNKTTPNKTNHNNNKSKTNVKFLNHSTIQILISVVTNWKWIAIFVVNQLATVAFYKALGDADMTLVVPVTQGSTLMFTALTAMLLGERKVKSLLSWVGLIFVTIGIIMMSMKS